MKLSETTVKILENFSKISNTIYFFPGNKQKVMTPAKSIFAEVHFEENFPIEFGIYDLTKFLSVLSLFDNPELDFSDKYVTIKDADSTATYWFTSKEVVKKAIVDPNKSITLPNVDLEFQMTKDDFKHLKSSSSVLGAPHFIIKGDGSDINLIVSDADDKTANQISKTVGSTTDTFCFVGDISSLKMIDDDYSVKVTKSGIIEMKAMNHKLTYWLAIRK